MKFKILLQIIVIFLFIMSCTKDVKRSSVISEKSLDSQVLEAYEEGKKAL